MLDSLRVLSKMTAIEPPYNWQDIKRRVDDGVIIFTGDYVNPTTPGFKYAIMQIDGLLYAFKLTDSTNEKIVLTPEQVAIYTDEYWSIIWTYLRDRDFMIADDDSMLTDVDSYFGEEFSHEKAKEFYRNPANKKIICSINDNRNSIRQFYKK